MSLPVMRQAFDAIVNVLAGGDFDNPLCDLKQAALALQQAIAEAEKPVHASDTSSERVNKTAKNEHEDWYGQWQWQCGYERGWDKAMEHKREWVGLTEQEKGWCAASTYSETVKRVEAKLKEKNDG